LVLELKRVMMIVEFKILWDYYFFLLAFDINHPGIGNLSEPSGAWRKKLKKNYWTPSLTTACL
jgi:hypothetical protein